MSYASGWSGPKASRKITEKSFWIFQWIEFINCTKISTGVIRCMWVGVHSWLILFKSFFYHTFKGLMGMVLFKFYLYWCRQIFPKFQFKIEIINKQEKSIINIIKMSFFELQKILFVLYKVERLFKQAMVCR